MFVLVRIPTPDPPHQHPFHPLQPFRSCTYRLTELRPQGYAENLGGEVEEHERGKKEEAEEVRGDAFREGGGYEGAVVHKVGDVGAREDVEEGAAEDRSVVSAKGGWKGQSRGRENGEGERTFGWSAACESVVAVGQLVSLLVFVP
jgi:hypothetical protein